MQHAIEKVDSDLLSCPPNHPEKLTHAIPEAATSEKRKRFYGNIQQCVVRYLMTTQSQSSLSYFIFSLTFVHTHTHTHKRSHSRSSI
jgi:hypothetical protein